MATQTGHLPDVGHDVSMARQTDMLRRVSQHGVEQGWVDIGHEAAHASGQLVCAFTFFCAV